MSEVFLPGIYEVMLTNFGGHAKYLGDSYEEARDCAIRCGFESSVLLDGSLIASYSPISGWKNYK